MDLDGSKPVCGICKDWQGERKWKNGIVRVKASARGKCVRMGKIKPAQGGCNHWEKWEGDNNNE